MSAINTPWEAYPKYPSDMDTWTDPRNAYVNANQQMLKPMRARLAPRLSDMPEQLLQEISVDPHAQRMWENLSGDEQWRLIERHEKQQAQAREQERIDAYDPNNDDAYSVSLSTAVDLWRAKHGDAWVRSFDVYENDDFYACLENRLRDNDCFERMEKYNRRWLRLKENV